MPWPSVRFTIAHLMAATLVIALALAPIPATLRSPTPEYIVATGAYEVVFLPVVVALIVMAMKPPGRERNFIIASLCATPVILLVIAFASSYAAALVLAGLQVVISPDPFAPQHVFFFLSFLWTTFYLLPRRPPRRCPDCRGFTLRELSRPDPLKRMWLPSGLYKCGQCGRSYRVMAAWPRNRLVPESPVTPE